MKKMFATTLLLAAIAPPLQAQGLEFSGGVTFSKLSGEAIQDAAQSAGVSFGVDFVIPLGPVALNLGADWSKKGLEDAVSAYDVSYIELPLHVRFPLVGAGPVRLCLIHGPTIGINTGCEVSVDGAAAENCADLVQDPFDPEKIEWAGTGGLGVSFGLGGLAYAGVELKYSVGLSNVSEGSTLAAKNRTFVLTTHLGFDIF